MSHTNRAFRLIRIALLIMISFILGEAAAMAFPNPLRFFEGKESSPTPAPAAEVAAPAVPPRGAPAIPPSFATVARDVKPSVVNVSTTQTVHTEGGPEPFGGPFSQQDPFQEFFRHFFNQTPHNFTQRSLGSGVIIDPTGYIVTNAHVIAHADKIVVKLEDGRDFDAKVVGSDPKTDVAVLKIAAPADLPAARLGNSDTLQVGDWVIAIGNPFGLSETVTAGIVSAKGRVIGEGPYEDFIQTDASINPGNSGGPLVNMEGEVIGINAAIFSQSGGNIGIGFAIPINLVKNVAQEIRQYGKVVRGWLGVTIQQVTPELAKSFGLQNAEGGLVAEVQKGSPAARAGFRQGDIILEYDGKPVGLAHQLPTMVAESKIGQTVSVTILRNGERKTLEVTVEEMPAGERAATVPASATPWGLAVADITPKLRQRFDLEETTGVVVTEVKRGSVAEDAGIRPGDVIREVDREPVENVQGYEKALAKSGSASQVLLLVQRQGQSLFVVLQKGA
jgi:serine protease Do